jgi:hypothetical protein
MEKLRQILNLKVTRALLLGAFVIVTNCVSFAISRVLVVREASIEINEANRRIEHLNTRLAAALHEDDGAGSCSIPPKART